MSISYYAAANTEKGFKSLFGEIFSPKELFRLYIIKGGPGTGKSTFMRGVAEAAEQRGFDVEYYYCSADTGSLDGVKIPSLKTALIDGTSPHSYEPKYPGACETVIDLGQNFDTGKLRENRSDIERLTDECSLCYARSSRFLRAAGETERMLFEVSQRAFDTDKAKKAVSRILGEAKPKTGKYTERYISAVGTRGMAHIKNIHGEGIKKVKISGKYGMDKLFIPLLSHEACACGYTVLRYPDVLLHDMTEGVYIDELETLYIISEDSENVINAMRFAVKSVLCENRGKIRFAEKCREALMQGAVSELAKMGSAHDELEKYYAEAMNFEKSNEMMRAVAEEIFR